MAGCRGYQSIASTPRRKATSESLQPALGRLCQDVEGLASRLWCLVLACLMLTAMVATLLASAMLNIDPHDPHPHHIKPMIWPPPPPPALWLQEGVTCEVGSEPDQVAPEDCLPLKSLLAISRRAKRCSFTVVGANKLHRTGGCAANMRFCAEDAAPASPAPASVVFSVCDPRRRASPPPASTAPRAVPAHKPAARAPTAMGAGVPGSLDRAVVAPTLAAAAASAAAAVAPALAAVAQGQHLPRQHVGTQMGREREVQTGAASRVHAKAAAAESACEAVVVLDALDTFEMLERHSAELSLDSSAAAVFGDSSRVVISEASPSQPPPEGFAAAEAVQAIRADRSVVGDAAAGPSLCWRASGPLRSLRVSVFAMSPTDNELAAAGGDALAAYEAAPPVARIRLAGDSIEWSAAYPTLKVVRKLTNGMHELLLTLHDIDNRTAPALAACIDILDPQLQVSAGMLTSCRTKPVAASAPAFVRRSGSRLEKHGQPYHFLGANVWYAMHLAAAEKEVGGDRTRFDREMDRLLSAGVRTVRLLACGEGSDSGAPNGGVLRPTLQPYPRKYDERVFRGLDYVLVAAASRNSELAPSARPARSQRSSHIAPVRPATRTPTLLATGSDSLADLEQLLAIFGWIRSVPRMGGSSRSSLFPAGPHSALVLEQRRDCSLRGPLLPGYQGDATGGSARADCAGSQEQHDRTSVPKRPDHSGMGTR